MRGCSLAKLDTAPSNATTSPSMTKSRAQLPTDRDVVVTACGRICMHRKRVNLSHLEQKTLQPLDNPFGPRLSPMS
jgi:hypothetical protein